MENTQSTKELQDIQKNIQKLVNQFLANYERSIIQQAITNRMEYGLGLLYVKIDSNESADMDYYLFADLSEDIQKKMKDNERLNETIFSIDEEKKLVLGQRTVVDEFDVNEIQQQVNVRIEAIKACQLQIKEFEEELEKINKFKSYIDKWDREFKEEQKTKVREFEERMKKNKDEKVVAKTVTFKKKK